MGQAWKVVNLDKMESIFAHSFDEGYKFLEFTQGSWEKSRQ